MVGGQHSPATRQRLLTQRQSLFVPIKSGVAVREVARGRRNVRIVGGQHSPAKRQRHLLQRQSLFVPTKSGVGQRKVVHGRRNARMIRR